jgi:Type IV secretory system Conjugative DNA transfer
VVRLDPFGVLGEPSDQFNPLDLLGESPSAEAFRIAMFLIPPDPASVSPLWRTSTISLLLGLIGSLDFAPGKEERNLIQLRKILSGDIKSRVKGGEESSNESQQLLSAFLAKSDVERDSILAIAEQALRIVGDPRVARAVERTSFEFGSLEIGRPMTIYLELPLARWPSSILLARLWVHSLLQLSASVTEGRRPQFICDLAFSNELFPILEPMQRLSNLALWTFWESPSQLQSRHPAEFSGFLNNAQLIEAIGPVSPVVAGELAALFGRSRETMERLAPGHKLVLQDS